MKDNNQIILTNIKYIKENLKLLDQNEVNVNKEENKF